MSHVVQIQTQVRDPAAILAACERLKLPHPVYGETRLFSGSQTGWQVFLPEWRYPLVIDVNTASIAYDNYHEYWGKKQELDRFLQGYAVEVAKLEARRKGHSVTEQFLADGSIKLTINVGGGL